MKKAGKKAGTKGTKTTGTRADAVKPAVKPAVSIATVKKARMPQVEPLPATFTLLSMLGLIITTVFTISQRIPLSWGIAFDLVFAIMFVASMISITPGEPEYNQ